MDVFLVRGAGRKWISYSNENNAIIAEALNEGKPSCGLNVNGWEYCVDLVEMIQVNPQSGTKRAIRRETLRRCLGCSIVSGDWDRCYDARIAREFWYNHSTKVTICDLPTCTCVQPRCLS